MKKIIFLVAVAIFALSCKEKVQETTTTVTEEITKTIAKEYPEGIAPVFKAHGGIQKWNDMKTLAFTLKKENGDERHTVDLNSRKVTIETEKYTLGFNGEKVWVA